MQPEYQMKTFLPSLPTTGE